MILLIGGTSETASLATGMARAGYQVLVSMATQAPLKIGDHPRISRRTGSLDEEGLISFVKKKNIQAIVDAAHPYAEFAHKAARGAAGYLGIPYLALGRAEVLQSQKDYRSATSSDNAMYAPSGASSTSTATVCGTSSLPIDACSNDVGHRRIGFEESSTCTDPCRMNAPEDRIIFAADHAEAARMAFAEGQPVFLTTGSHNLTPYAEAAQRTGVPFAVRVLDAPESIAACRAAGISQERIITGRGPFSLEENLTAIRRFAVGVIVTKESGRVGGIEEKLAAAAQSGCRIIVIRRPEVPWDDPVFDQPAALITALMDLVPVSLE